MKNGDDIRPISHLALEWLGPSQDSCLATQIKAHCHRTSAGKKRGKRTPNYANPQDEYILILLEYKLMLWLSDWTFWQEWEVDRITFTFSTWGASVWHRINSQSLNKLSFGQTQHIIKLHTVRAADSSRKPLKRRATVFIKNNEGVKRRKKKLVVSVTPSESPLGHLTCKGNEYFVDWFVPSHIEPSFLKSTLVTLDLSCMEVRALGPAEVD